MKVILFAFEIQWLPLKVFLSADKRPVAAAFLHAHMQTCRPELRKAFHGVTRGQRGAALIN